MKTWTSNEVFSKAAFRRIHELRGLRSRDPSRTSFANISDEPFMCVLELLIEGKPQCGWGSRSFELVHKGFPTFQTFSNYLTLPT
jgi:hypothetical protein